MGWSWKARKIAKNYQSQIILVLTPLLLVPLLLIDDEEKKSKCDISCESCVKNEATGEYLLNEDGDPYTIQLLKPYKCLFSLVLMSVYWTFEVTPLAVTSLTPMFMFPMFGLLPASRVAAHYFKDTNFLFFGGLIVAIAIEKCNLHLRIALSVMKIAGSKLHTMMGAFMAVTAFLSMWISNTATTAMMLPIAVATVNTINGEDDEKPHPELDHNNGYNREPLPKMKPGKSMLSLNLARFGGFISSVYSRNPSRATSAVPSPMASTTSMNNASRKSIDSAHRQSRPKRISELKKASTMSTPPKIVVNLEEGFGENAEAELSPYPNESKDGFENGLSATSLQIPDQSQQTICGETDHSYQQLVSRQRIPRKSKENGKLLMKAMLLAVAYSANIGGIGTLIGTPVNLILGDQLKSVFAYTDHSAQAGEEINFLTWMYFAVPVSIVCNILCWMWLLTVYVGPAKVFHDITSGEESPEDQKVSRDIKKRYDALGKMSYTETVVLIHFVTLAILWFTRSPKFVPGWEVGFEPGHVKDSTAALLICFSLFVFPSKPNFFRWLTGRPAELDQNNMPKPAASILHWKEVQKTLAWDVIILLGAGFALADACQATGLSVLLGKKIAGLMGSLPLNLIPLIISLMISFITGFCSNTSTASVFLPILMNVCVTMNMNPLLLCIPATMACSFAFILPIATPPNAIAFSYGHLETIDMIKVGTLLNFVCVMVTAIFLPLIATPLYNLGNYPHWAMTDLWKEMYSNETIIDLATTSTTYVLDLVATASGNYTGS